MKKLIVTAIMLLLSCNIYAANNGSYCITVCNKTDHIIQTNIVKSKNISKKVRQDFGYKKQHIKIPAKTCKSGIYPRKKVMQLKAPSVTVCIEGKKAVL